MASESATFLEKFNWPRFTMNTSLYSSVSPGTFAAAIVAPVMLAQSCLQIEATTRVHPDGSGHFAFNMNVNSALLEFGVQSDSSAGRGFSEELPGGYSSDLFQGLDTLSADDLAVTAEDLKKLREDTDTVPGIHFDTAFIAKAEGRTRAHFSVAFDSIEALNRIYEGQADEDVHSLPVLRRQGRTVTLSFLPGQFSEAETGQDSTLDRITEQYGLDADSTDDNRIANLGTELVNQILDVRFRYVLPEGTAVDTASPPVTRTDSVVVYEWQTRDLMDAAINDDSLYLTAQLPSEESSVGLIVVGFVVGWLFVGAVAFYLHRYRR